MSGGLPLRLVACVTCNSLSTLLCQFCGLDIESSRTKIQFDSAGLTAGWAAHSAFSQLYGSQVCKADALLGSLFCISLQSSYMHSKPQRGPTCKSLSRLLNVSITQDTTVVTTVALLQAQVACTNPCWNDTRISLPVTLLSCGHGVRLSLIERSLPCKPEEFSRWHEMESL